MTVMWLVRLLMRYPRPCARGRKRLSVGPSSTHARRTQSMPRSRPPMWSALAIALASTLPTGSLAACGENSRTACAWSAGSPRIRSTTRRAFRGVTRTYRALALASIWFVPFQAYRRLRRSSLTWLRKVRVGANSPSLCPTIDSVMNTGMCLRPSCTAMVWPSMAGTIMDRRDHVLITVLVPLSFCTSTFFIRWSSTKGPFFRLRGISGCSLPLVLAAAAADHPVTGLVRPPGTALRLAPGADRVATARALALATAERVIDRVHGHATHRRPLALPAVAARLAELDVALLGVADFADRRAALHADPPDLAGRHAQGRVAGLLGQQLDAGARRTRDLRAATGTQLDGVDDRAGRDRPQRQRVARLDVRAWTVLHPVALGQALGCEDVPLLAVHVVQQSDARRPVRVVLDVRDLGRNAVLVVSPEVDQPVGTLVPATLVPRGYPPVDVPAALAVQRADQRLFRLAPGDLGEVGAAGATPTGGGRLVLTDSHLRLLN